MHLTDTLKLKICLFRTGHLHGSVFVTKRASHFLTGMFSDSSSNIFFSYALFGKVYLKNLVLQLISL